MQPIATGAPADDDHQVAGTWAGRVRALGGDAQAADKDQRVGREALIVEDGAADRGQAQLVAVVLNAGDDARS